MTTLQSHSEEFLDAKGAEWRRWILDNIERGCAAQTMLEKLIEGGWPTLAAISALQEGSKKLGMEFFSPCALPHISTDAAIDIDGQAIAIVAAAEKPQAMLLDGVLSVAECDQLIALAVAKGLRRSAVVDGESGASIEHAGRTSTSVCFTRNETPLISAIEHRLAQLTHWPADHAEGLQVLCYGPGQEYKEHYDWFDAGKPGGDHHLARGGQRLATTVLYLATAIAGGGTRFPSAGLEFSPRRGGAVFFADVDALGQPDTMSLHAGSPVIAGTKIVATYWQRQRVFV